jgi:hypothetical protein
MVSDNKDLSSQFNFEGFATAFQGNCQVSLTSGILHISLLGKTDADLQIIFLWPFCDKLSYIFMMSLVALTAS